MNRLLDAALGYAARGIPVYPGHWPHPAPGRASLTCSCPRGLACDRPAKHPLLRHGVKEATTDPDRIGSLVATLAPGQCRPGHRSGVRCAGHRRPRGPGRSTSSEKRRAYGSRVRWWPRAAVAGTTGSPHRTRQPPTHGLAHVDWRGRGGCVLAPPSRHISGHSYRWLVGLDKAPLVEVLAALRLLLDPNPPTPARPARTPGPDLAGHPYGRAALAAELAALGRATPGHRNYTLNRTAFKVYRYVAGGVLDDQDVTLAFTTVARAIGLSAAETARTLASARTAGLANPRTIPTAPDPSHQEIGP